MQPLCFKLAICTVAGALGFTAVTSDVAHAQTPAAHFVGTWNVEWQGARTPQQARLIITESGGTFQRSARTKFDPCVGAEAPIALQDINGQDATVLVKYSEALQGCADWKLQIQKIDDQTMTGKRGSAVLSIKRS